MGHAVSTDQMRSLRKERRSTLSFEFQAHSRPWTKPHSTDLASE